MKHKYPELFNDEDLNELTYAVYRRCSDDCDWCEKHLEVDGKTCMAEIIDDLWRHWLNIKSQYDALLEDVQGYQGSICCYCKNVNNNNCEHFGDLTTEDGIPLQCGKWKWRGAE